MNKKLFPLALLFFIGLAACAAPVSTPIIMVTATPALVTPTPSVASSATPAESPTAAASNLFGISPFTVEDACVTVSDDPGFFQGKEIGKLVLDRDPTLEIKLTAPFVYDFKTGKNTQYPGASSFVVSPDGSQMAYVGQDERLTIADADGKIVAQYPFPDISITEWAGDGLFAYVNLDPGQLAFYDSKTGKRELLPNEFPELADIGKMSYWYPHALYSPNRKMVIYPINDAKNRKIRIALWNVERDEEFESTSNLPYIYYLGDTRPEWSKDGKQAFLVTGRKQEGASSLFLMLVNIQEDGKITPLWERPSDIYVLWYSISPDNDLLAYWNVADSGNYLLQVLNISTGHSKNLCLGESLGISPKPIWSPDGRYLAVELVQMEGSEVWVVDLQTNTAAKVAENARPVGWLK